MDEALKVPALYCTAFQVRPDFPCDDILDAKPASLSGQALDKNETILRIEIREFDVFHSTQQVSIIHVELLPVSELSKYLLLHNRQSNQDPEEEHSHD